MYIMQGTWIYNSYIFIGKKISYSSFYLILYILQIIFEAIRGDDWNSDIALDDVILSVGTCLEGKYTWRGPKLF